MQLSGRDRWAGWTAQMDGAETDARQGTRDLGECYLHRLRCTQRSSATSGGLSRPELRFNCFFHWFLLGVVCFCLFCWFFLDFIWIFPNNYFLSCLRKCVFKAFFHHWTKTAAFYGAIQGALWRGRTVSDGHAIFTENAWVAGGVSA